jgi:HEAT repeat protein
MRATKSHDAGALPWIERFAVWGGMRHPEPFVADEIHKIVSVIHGECEGFWTNAVGTSSEFGHKDGPLAGLIVSYLSDDEVRVRRWACDVLANIRPAAVVVLDPLVKALTSDADAEVRFRAGFALERLGKPATPALEAISTAANDPDPDTRGIAALIVARLDRCHAAGIPVLLGMLNSTDRHTRQTALMRLGQSGVRSTGVHSALLLILRKDDDEEVRADAAWALGALGAFPKATTGALLEALDNRPGSLSVHWRILRALGQFGAKATAALPRLQEMSDRKDCLLANNAEAAMAMIRGQRAAGW